MFLLINADDTKPCPKSIKPGKAMKAALCRNNESESHKLVEFLFIRSVLHWGLPRYVNILLLWCKRAF